MNCDDLLDYYYLYVLGVAEDPEQSEIREHLGRRCPVCTTGVRQARELAALLGTAAPSVTPPARLRRKVTALVSEPPRSPRWAHAWALVAAAAVIAAVFLNVRERRASEELARLSAQASFDRRELERVNQALAILNAPEARQVVFGEGQPQPPRGRVFLDPRRGVLLLASNLPPAPAGKIYEMWVIPKGGQPVPAGLFQSEADSTALHLLSGPVNLAQTGAIAVTLEPAGGVPQPTSTPIIVAAL